MMSMGRFGSGRVGGMLSHLAYNIGIGAYTLGVCVASLFNDKARLMRRGWRLTWREVEMHKARRHAVWFHASSLGEFEQARPVIESYRKAHPEAFILLTFFSPSGYEVRHDYSVADKVLYMPMDLPRNARRLVHAFKPEVAFFVKYDFWFNYLLQLKETGCRTFLFSSIFRPRHYFFRWYGGWFCKQLAESYEHLYVQNVESVTLLQSHGVANVSMAGDTRFDRVADIAAAAQQFPLLESFTAGGKVLLAGSSWEPDEQLLHQYLLHAPADLKLVLAPHVISQQHIRSIVNLFGEDICCCYTQMQGSAPSPDCRVMIVDTMGMLSALYRYATVAYIGGGFGRGIHNTLEAVAFAKPVVFGPNYRKFQEACQLVERGGGFTYKRYDELQTILDSLFDDEGRYSKASQICQNYLNENLGSTHAIMQGVQ